MLVAAGITAGVTLAVDQVVKTVTRKELRRYEVRDLAFDGQIAVGNISNYGSAYGIVGKMPAWAPAVATAAIGGGMLAFARGARHPIVAGVGAGLVIGGGIGNVIDRAHQGYITDMLHTSDLFGFYNIADIAIMGGLAVGIGAMLIAR